MSGTVLRLSERLLLAYSTQFDANKIVHCFLLLKVLFIFGFTESSLLCVPFPLVSGGGGHSLVVVLTAVVSFVAEHGLSSGGRPAYLLRGMWDPPEQGLNLCPLHGQANSQPLDRQGSPSMFFLNQRIHLFIRRAGLTGWI